MSDKPLHQTLSLERRRAYVQGLTAAALALGVAGAALGFLDTTVPFSPFPLVGGLAAVMLAAWVLGRSPDLHEEATKRERTFTSELWIHGFAVFLHLIFLLVALVEVLAIPAALGRLTVFGQLALGFVAYFPTILAVLLSLLAGSVWIGLRVSDAEPLSDRERKLSMAALAATSVLGLLAMIASYGLIPDVKPERAVFVLAAGLVSAFFWVRVWTRIPNLRATTDWLERHERQGAHILRHVSHAMSAASVVLLLVSLIPFVGVFPPGITLPALGSAMLVLLPATYGVSSGRVHAEFGMSGEDVADRRRKQRIILNAASITLTLIGTALAILTLLAFLAQVVGVELLRSLLGVFVAMYPAILALVILALAAVVLVRTHVPTDREYTDRLKAITTLTSVGTIVFTFFGVFIGSGLAEGTGVVIENAVLAMGGAAILLISFVFAHTRLPGLLSMLHDLEPEAAEELDTKDRIRRQMMVTYVVGTVFILGLVSFVTAQALDAGPRVGEELSADVTVLFLLLLGLATAVLVAMRYFQSMGLDPQWKQQEEEIGKKRITSEEFTRYLVLGLTGSVALILFAIGVLVNIGAIQGLGPLEIEKRFATDFYVFAILLALGPYGWFTTREAARVRSIDTKFPEFLRDLAESQRAGMTLTESVVTASKGNYGTLTPEIRKMAAQIEWGISFQDALERFSSRVRTPLIERTVTLIIQAANSGGNVVDVLTAAADDAREIHMIVKERRQSMSIYVMIIYIAFLVFIGVIAILNAQFIPEVSKAVSKATENGPVKLGGLNFKAFDEQAFKTLFFHAAVIQGLGGGFVAGVMEGGKPLHGIRHGFIMTVIAYAVFRFLIGG